MVSGGVEGSGGRLPQDGPNDADFAARRQRWRVTRDNARLSSACAGIGLVVRANGHEHHGVALDRVDESIRDAFHAQVVRPHVRQVALLRLTFGERVSQDRRNVHRGDGVQQWLVMSGEFEEILRGGFEKLVPERHLQEAWAIRGSPARRTNSSTNDGPSTRRSA
jgi:hypothetical protein